MRAFIVVTAAGLFVASTALAGEPTWTGQVTDSLCGAKHEEAAEGQGKMSDRDCTQACVRGGSKYAFVSKGKLYQVANQTNPDLPKHAGHVVTLTGEAKGDSITVSTIEMVAEGGKGV